MRHTHTDHYKLEEMFYICHKPNFVLTIFVAYGIMCTSFFPVQINPALDGKKKRKKKDTEVEENFYDIVDMDEGHAQEFIADKFITRFLDSTGFQTFMMAVIFLNAVELALRTKHQLVSTSAELSHENLTFSDVNIIFATPTPCYKTKPQISRSIDFKTETTTKTKVENSDPSYQRKAGLFHSRETE